MSMKFNRTILLSAALVVAMLLLGTSATQALTVKKFDGRIKAPGGEVVGQAGAHADIANSVEFEIGENVKNVEVDLPPGIVGNPQSMPTCTHIQLATGPLGASGCPDSTQVGTVALTTLRGGSEESLGLGLYNMVPAPGAPAQFGFNVVGVQVYLTAALRPDDFGITIRSIDTSQSVNIVRSDVTVWGVPAASVHDQFRGPIFLPGFGSFLCNDGGSPPCAPHTPEKPYLSLGSNCAAGPMQVLGRANGWDEPGVVAEPSFVFEDEASPPAPLLLTGCEKVPFEPTFTMAPDASAAGVPTGASLTLRIPQSENPAGLSSANLKDVSVALPRGMSLNPAAAGGLGGCSPTAAGLGRSGPIGCPPSSRIGSLEAVSPVLAEPLKGGVYEASQGDNPFGSLLALYLAIESPERGVFVKLAGKVSADPRTGQLTATFEDNPQLPVESLKVRLKDGPRAPLVTPSDCGTFTTQAEMTSWARPNEPLSSDSQFQITENCETSSRFTPALEAGTTNPAGGSYSPFILRLTRPDGQANVAGLEARLPEGLLAKLAGVPLCGDAQAVTGECPAGSQVGSVTVGVGAGSNPLYVPEPGKAPTAVYLAGPYKGAPYSLVVKVPAQAGPFDLGTVAVRNALYVDPVTTQVTAKSDPLPQILEGIPISYRDVRVEVDRPEFTLNPTSCDPMSVEATITGAAGATASPSSRFQAASCERLAFKPKLAVNLKGAVRRTGHPAVKAVLTMPPGADIARAQVGLPHSLFLDQGNLDNVCRQADLKAGTCPKSAIYGRARAWSPLLDRPLEGPVYLGVGYGHKLPDLVADLDGQIRVLLNAKIDTTKKHGLRATFQAVPDAPVSRFVLEMKGGRKYGLIENSENLCRSAQRASAQFTGHNGKGSHLSPTIGRGCGKAKKKSHAGHGGGTKKQG